jgi:hypothetical protein
LPPGLDLTQLYKLEWTDAITDNVLTLLETAALPVEAIVRRWQQTYQHLFKPLGPISADPNPGNWGLREDGSPVLFDWERFSFGTPALDLAILIPGLPDRAAFYRYAENYLKLNQGDSQVTQESPEGLAGDIKVAKVWVVLEFLYMYVTGATGIPKAKVANLCESLPGWLESLA